MSILSQIPTGGLLEKPKGQTTRCQESEESLTERLLAGLLPAQKDFVEDDQHLILGMCAGFGAGKPGRCVARSSCWPCKTLDLWGL